MDHQEAIASSGEHHSARKHKKTKKSNKHKATATDSEPEHQTPHADSKEEELSTDDSVASHHEGEGKKKRKRKKKHHKKKKFDPLAELSEVQLETLQLFKVRLSLAADEDGTTGEDKWSKRQLAWLDDMCLLRYLRARDYDLDLSEAMIRATLKWRKEYKPHKITAQEVEPEARQAKMYLHPSYDKANRPIVYMKPGLDTGTDPVLKVKYMVYILEKAIELMDTEHGIERMSWIADFSGSGMKQSSLANIKLSKECLHIVCDHYPERLGKAFLINTPWVFSAFWKCISPLIPPITAEKIRVYGDDYEADINDNIDPSALEAAYGGESDFQYDHAKWCHDNHVTPPAAKEGKKKK